MKEKKGSSSSQIWNVPNVLTMLRIVLIAVFVYLFYIPENYVAAGGVYLVAGITDLLDGYIARKCNLITDFGRLMDPLADKLMLIAALICFVSRGYLPLPILLFVLVKEGLMLFAGAFLYKQKVVVYSKVIGKIASFCFNAGVILTFLGTTFFSKILEYHIDWILYAIAIILGILAFIQYLNSFWRQR